MNQPGIDYRVTHHNDIVPRIPPMWLGYRHIEPEYYIDTDTGVSVTPNNITEYTSEDNRDGVMGDAWSIQAHTWYFYNVATCSPGFFGY